MSFKYGFFSLILFAWFIPHSIALAALKQERLIVSNCMADKLKEKANILSQSKSFSVIETVLTKNVLLLLKSNKAICGQFLNLEPYNNQTPQQLLSTKTKQQSLPTKRFLVKHDLEVKQLYSQIDPSKIWQNSQHLTSYVNRSAKTNSGVAAALWFKQQVDTLAQDYGRKDVSSFLVKTGRQYKQPSVVTVIGQDKTKEAIVIGAHIDTLSGNMPGADDDASGIAVALEITRVLLSADFKLDSPVYIIAYAAEEQGLVGSGYVVQYFIDQKIPVKAVMQLDQAGYRANPKDNTIWLIDDYVDNELTQFLAQLLTHHVKIPVAYSHCGYACSDHANWTINGFKACYPSATTLSDDNPYLHSSEDKLEIINLDHMVNFTKLGLAFATELGLH